MKQIGLLILLLVIPWVSVKAELMLPGNLTIIEDEAFYGDKAVTRVTIPDGVSSIGALAFAATNLEAIAIPGTVTTIAPDAFEGICTPMLIDTDADSVAADFALQHNLDFRANTVFRALLIGQTDYPGIYKLEGPGKDIVKLGETLDAYYVTTKTNLTAEEILKAVSTSFFGSKEQDISLFYYSGHGDEASGALVGIDMESKVTAAQLRSALDEIPGRKVIIVDACYSGALIGRSLLHNYAVDPAALFIDAFKPRIRARSSNLAVERNYVIASSKGDEESWEASYGGIFSNAFAESKNSGDLDGDQVVTFEEAYLYTKEKVDKIASSNGKTQSVQVYPENCYWFGMFR